MSLPKTSLAEAADNEEEEMRKFFPAGFGKQALAFDSRAVVEKTKRADAPPSRPAAAVVGPTRPVVGPARPTIGPARPSPKPAPDHQQQPQEQEQQQKEAAVPPQPAADVDFIGPPRPPPSASSDDDDDDGDDDGGVGESQPRKRSREEIEEEEDEEEQEQQVDDVKLPVTHEIELKGHHKAVSALAVDPSGARLLTGGFDYIVKFWDFGGMNSLLQSFREIEPCGGHQIKTLVFSNTGDRFLVASGSAQPKIFDRDGFELGEFIKGDQYLADMQITKGHVASVSNAMWHPHAKDTVLTCSIDGTVRLWDVNDLKRQKIVIKTKDRKGLRTSVHYASYGLNASLIAAACQDGSIQIWNGKGPYSRPDTTIVEAHVPDTETSCINFSLDGHTMITRGGDNTLKVWDLRNTQHGPIRGVTGLANYFGQTDCIFSPDDRFIVTGTSVKKDEGRGLLIFFDKTTLRPVRHLGMGKNSVVRILWHKQLNQIFVGGSDAVARVLYDPDLSVRGALMSVARAPRKSDPGDFTPDRPIQNPHSLPMFKPEPTGRRKKEKDRKDPIKSHKPDLPTQGPGTGTARGSFTAHLLKRMGTLKPLREEDPREAILKYAKEAEENPLFFGAYKTTQPKPIFNTETQEEPPK